MLLSSPKMGTSSGSGHSYNRFINQESGELVTLSPTSVPTCSIVVCTRNRPLELARCLKALANLDYSGYEIVVVGNAPSDARARDLATHWRVRYLIEPIVGLSRARNTGALTCDTEIVAFIDDDAIPEPNWLAELARVFDDPMVFAATGKVLPIAPPGMQATCLCAPYGCFDGGLQERVLDRLNPLWFELANFGGIGDGGNMAFRRRAFDAWPGFDERLGRGTPLYGAEEHYAFFGLIDRGFRVIYTPNAVVRHPFASDLQDIRSRHLKDLAAASGYMMFLFFEEPRYRRRLLRYLGEWLRGDSRAWRPDQVALPRTRIVPRWRMVLARLSGPVLYAQAWFARHGLRGRSERAVK
jgi:glycosyltransferase involved in cell wall biosynthesis